MIVPEMIVEFEYIANSRCDLESIELEIIACMCLINRLAVISCFARKIFSSYSSLFCNELTYYFIRINKDKEVKTPFFHSRDLA